MNTDKLGRDKPHIWYSNHFKIWICKFNGYGVGTVFTDGTNPRSAYTAMKYCLILNQLRIDSEKPNERD